MSGGKEEEGGRSPSSPSSSPSSGLVRDLEVEGRRYRYYDVTLLGEDYLRLPYSLRVMLECAVRRGHRAEAATADAWKESAK